MGSRCSPQVRFPDAANKKAVTKYNRECALSVRAKLKNCFLLLAILASSNLFNINMAYPKDKKEYRIGIDGTYPPFSHRNLDGEYLGFDIDIANALCQAMKIKCTLVKYEWNNLLAAVRGKKVDFVIASVDITRPRRELVDFSAPYLQTPSAIVVGKDSILSGLDIEDLRDAQFGVLKSSPHGEYIRTHRPDTHIKLYENEADYFVDLANRKLDGIVGNPILLNDWLKTSDGKNCCRLLGTLPHDDQINGEGFGIAVEKNSDKLLKRINKALKSIRKSGKYAKIMRTHLPFLK